MAGQFSRYCQNDDAFCDNCIIILMDKYLWHMVDSNSYIASVATLVDEVLFVSGIRLCADRPRMQHLQRDWTLREESLRRLRQKWSIARHVIWSCSCLVYFYVFWLLQQLKYSESRSYFFMNRNSVLYCNDSVGYCCLANIVPLLLV